MTEFTKREHDWIEHLFGHHDAAVIKKIGERAAKRLENQAALCRTLEVPVELTDEDREKLVKAKRVCDCPEVGNWRPPG